MLKLQHLTKQFGAAPLFTDLCMEVDAPVVLWAPSDSVEGVGRVAAVCQEDRLCPQLNAVQNVTLVLPGAENQYKEQIASDFQQLGMDTAALQLPARRLSGGQKRRVALLRALWASSDTLLLDEPFTGMDPDTLQRAAALLRQRCAGKPVLLATHDESAIRALGWPVVELKSWDALECPPLCSGHDLWNFCLFNIAFVALCGARQKLLVLKLPKKQGRAARGLHVLAF